MHLVKAFEPKNETIREIPVVELYGPVIQGEGLVIGCQTMFLRLGGCDFRCKHCDSMYAVDPDWIKSVSVKYTVEQITRRVIQAMTIRRVRMLTISGGNPLIYDLRELVEALRTHGLLSSVETQASVWRDWVELADYISLSPKGPGMIGDKSEANIQSLKTFLKKLHSRPEGLKGVYIKIPILTDEDLEFAWRVERELGDLNVNYPGMRDLPRFLSLGNVSPPMKPGDKATDVKVLRDQLVLSYKELCDKVMLRLYGLSSWRVLPQLHVWLYGNEKGR